MGKHYERVPATSAAEIETTPGTVGRTVVVSRCPWPATDDSGVHQSWRDVHGLSVGNQDCPGEGIMGKHQEQMPSASTASVKAAQGKYSGQYKREQIYIYNDQYYAEDIRECENYTPAY